jgi:hypothetical protein
MSIEDLNENQKRGLLKVIKLYLTLNITLYSLDEFTGTRFFDDLEGVVDGLEAYKKEKATDQLVKK